MREEVSSKIAEVAKCANISTSSITENLEGRIREVAAHTDTTMTHTVRELQSKMREFVEAHHRNLEAKIEYNRAEMRHTTSETKATVDKLSAQLAQLATQLAEIQPARSADVVMGQHELSQDVSVRI